MLSRVVYKKQRGRRLLTALAAASLIGGMFLVASNALAVHDAGVFQLDKNASTAVNPAPTALEDWDLICKASQPSSTPPGECVFAPGYAIPAGTTTADPFSFQVDPSQSQQDDILKGGTKDDNDLNTWKWASAKPSPPKNDLTDAYAAEYEATVAQGGVEIGDSLLYFGADRFSNNGSANIAFWFFQNRITQSGAQTDGTCASGAGCPWSGVHKEGNVSLGGTTPGDILIISAFGPKAAINIYEWVGLNNAIDPPGPTGCFTSTCTLQPLVVGGQACEDVTNDNACATVNDVATASPWVVEQSSGPDNSFLPTNFFEGGLNLTALNIDACFSSFVVNTRSSAAGNAELHDVALGQFARCVPTMDTTASTNGTVTPGTPVRDTATITVAGAASPADPTSPPNVFFSLCFSATANPDCTTGGTLIGSTGSALNGGTNTTDGVASAVSADVNTAAAPLAPGFYCFRADWAGDENYPEDLTFTNLTDECFTVSKLPTTTVTTPGTLDGTTFTPITTITLGGSVVDRAVVTGSAAGGDPTGDVNFFVCTPAQLTPANTGVCAAGGGSAVTGNPKTLVSDGVAATFTSRAISGTFTPLSVGKYCFRANYLGSTVYDASNDTGSEAECFTVTDTTGITSVQTWRPNDSATVTSVNGALLNGTLTITLHESNDCGGAAVSGQTYSTTLTGATSPQSLTTTNTAYDVLVTKSVSWKTVFASTDPNVTGFTKCETTSLTINNNP